MIQRLQVKRNEKGFTLIELLIVIIVLGILAAIVVFAVGTTRSDAVEASCKTDLKSIELSAEAVNVKSGKYSVGDPITGVEGALLKEMPGTDDYAFKYVGEADGSDYTLTVHSVDDDGDPVDAVAACDTV